MSALAPTLEAFFTQRLIGQRRASPNTVAAYRDAWRLLLSFAERRTGKAPNRLEVSDLDARLISAFLEHLETERGNSVRTRNARLAAIRSFFHYAALCHPEHAGTVANVLAIPSKRTERKEVSYLTGSEVEALVESPDRGTWTGRRDHALLAVAIQTGLRVSELTGLTNQDVELGTGAHVRCLGKGRKERSTPLDHVSTATLRVWMKERGGGPTDVLFPTRRDTRLSRDAVGALVTKHSLTGQDRCPTLKAKHPTPHTLRHSCAMDLLTSGVDRTVVALWLGHERVETTGIYTHADMTIKQRALARTAPLGTKPGRYQPPDPLLAFLANL
jgi:integrase/recombinase XerD